MLNSVYIHEIKTFCDSSAEAALGFDELKICRSVKFKNSLRICARGCVCVCGGGGGGGGGCRKERVQTLWYATENGQCMHWYSTYNKVRLPHSNLQYAQGLLLVIYIARVFEYFWI